LKKQKAVCATNSSRGEGKQAVAGKTVSVHYEGSLESGKVLIVHIQEKTNRISIDKEM
jgi:hypothetical protein